METFFLIIFFILGAIMGSFYHVVATRLSNDQSIIKPGFHCPRCNNPIKWYDNIPIISYILLKGKCRNCHSKIPISYWIVELVTGLLFAVCYHSFELTLDLLIALIFTSSLIIVIVSDIEYMIILDEVLIFAIVGIIIVNIIDIGFYETSIQILNGAGSFATMLLIKKMGDFIFKQESLGGGDIKLMFLVGLVIGYAMSVCNIFLATFIAFPIALILLLTKKDNIIPFGPFLSMAAIILYVWGINFVDVINFIIT